LPTVAAAAAPPGAMGRGRGDRDGPWRSRSVQTWQASRTLPTCGRRPRWVPPGCSRPPPSPVELVAVPRTGPIRRPQRRHWQPAGNAGQARWSRRHGGRRGHGCVASRRWPLRSAWCSGSPWGRRAQAASRPVRRRPVRQQPSRLGPLDVGGGPASGVLSLPGNREKGRWADRVAHHQPAQSGCGPAGGLRRGKSPMPEGRLSMNTRRTDTPRKQESW